MTAAILSNRLSNDPVSPSKHGRKQQDDNPRVGGSSPFLRHWKGLQSGIF